MKLFACGACGQMLHFENSSCLACGAPLGFRPDRLELATLDPLPAGGFRPIGGGGDEAWVFCANAASGGCNWLVPLGGDAYCPACGLNRTIPDLDIAGNAERWRAIETAKRRLIYALRRFGLPMTSQHEDAGQGLAFDFLADAGAEPVMTGHADGLVTINIAEADSAERERRRLWLYGGRRGVQRVVRGIAGARRRPRARTSAPSSNVLTLQATRRACGGSEPLRARPRVRAYVASAARPRARCSHLHSNLL